MKIILEFEKSTWPEDPDIRYGENEMKYLYKTFLLNHYEAISGVKKIIFDKAIDSNNVMPEFDIVLRTFWCSTTECERGFSVMKNI